MHNITKRVFRNIQNDKDIFYTYESSQRHLSTKMQTRIFTKTLILRNANTKTCKFTFLYFLFLN